MLFRSLFADDRYSVRSIGYHGTRLYPMENPFPIVIETVNVYGIEGLLESIVAGLISFFTACAIPYSRNKFFIECSPLITATALASVNSDLTRTLRHAALYLRATEMQGG